MKLDTLEKLYFSQLKDMHSAESQVAAFLPRMIDAASAAPLKEALNKHLAETRTHIDRIEQLFDGADFSPRGNRCEATAGLIEEAKEVLASDGDSRVKDAAIVCAVQQIEHYEIGTYGCIRAYAKLLGKDADAKVIESTLRDEVTADESLSEMAEQWLNAFAMASN